MIRHNHELDREAAKRIREAERSEYAPAGSERDAIAHVAEAAERDRAQTTAHDEALRAELAKLPTAEIAARRSELGTPARGEARDQESYARQVRAVEERRGQVEQATANREAVEALGWRERRQKLPSATERERLFSERLAEERAKLAQMKPPSSAARRECEIADRLLDTRSARALAAARIEPPAYIVKELGEEASRSGKGQGLGSQRPGNRKLLARIRSEGHAQRLRPRAAGRQQRAWLARRHDEGSRRLSAGSALSSS